MNFKSKNNSSWSDSACASSEMSSSVVLCTVLTVLFFVLGIIFHVEFAKVLTIVLGISIIILSIIIINLIIRRITNNHSLAYPKA